MQIKRGLCMKTEITSRKISVNGNLVCLILLILIGVSGCTTNCERQIVIYEGLYFQKDQNFELSIDEKILLSKRFETDVQRNDFKESDTYCCVKDSCKVKFVLGASDTIFYITPLRTKRLMVGSDINGRFSVATDENKRAWIKM